MRNKSMEQCAHFDNSALCPTCTPQHTPTPYTYSQLSEGLGEKYVISAPDGREIAVVHSKPNAAFIVRAVNAHDELLSALKALGTLPEGYCFCPSNRQVNADMNSHTGECAAALQAIAKAEGK